jgi:hypothetical protein
VLLISVVSSIIFFINFFDSGLFFFTNAYLAAHILVIRLIHLSDENDP